METVEQNGADADMDLREYDENNDLVGLAAVGELSASESESDETEDGESDEVEEGESAESQPDEESDC